MSTLAFYEDTVRLEGDIKHFYHSLSHKKDRVAKIVNHYQSQKFRSSLNTLIVFNTGLNLSLLAFLASLLN